jgi:5-methylcytosine-specific restriction endonuclease McrA
MESSVKPLSFYKDPFVYSVTVTILSFILIIYGVYTNSPAMYGISIFLIAGLVSSYLIYETRCPQCHIPFTKREQGELKERLREEIRPYNYYDKIQYFYSDGNLKSTINDKLHTINERWEINRHHFKCKKCNHTWTKMNEINLDLANRPRPQIKKVQTKEKSPISGLAEQFNEEQSLGLDIGRKNTKESSFSKEKVVRKTPPLSKFEAEKVIKQRGYICQYPGCRERNSLEVHHIVQRSNGGSHNNANLIVLCPTHHHKADRGEIPATRLKMINSKN